MTQEEIIQSRLDQLEHKQRNIIRVLSLRRQMQVLINIRLDLHQQMLDYLERELLDKLPDSYVDMLEGK